VIDLAKAKRRWTEKKYSFAQIFSSSTSFGALPVASQASDPDPVATAVELCLRAGS